MRARSRGEHCLTNRHSVTTPLHRLEHGTVPSRSQIAVIKSTLRAMQGVRVPLPRRSHGEIKKKMPGYVDSAPIQRRDSASESGSATYEGTRPIVNKIHDRAVVGALLTLVTGGDSHTTLPGPTGYTAGGKLGNLRASAPSSSPHSSEGTPLGSTPDLLSSESSSCPGASDVLSADARVRLDSILGAAGTEWQFDAFRLESVALQQNPLSTLGMHCIVRWSGLAASLGLHERRLARFLVTIEGGYLDNPYHNGTHAADVLQTSCMIWAHGGVRELPVIGDLEGLGLMIGAAVHDYEHPGYNNAFLVGSGASWLHVPQ